MKNASRKVSHGTNTSNVRSVSKGVETALRMEDGGLVTKEESEARVREAVARAEEEIYGCPLLQKAMARVEAEALGLASSQEEKAPEEKVDGRDFGCQVGDEEHLRPFVISVGLQCKLDETAPLVLEKDKTEIRDSRPVDPARERVVRSVGVGDCKVN